MPRRLAKPNLRQLVLRRQPKTGSISQPWNTIFEGLDACLVGGALNVQAGNYLQNPNIFKAKSINALNGTVRIGN